MGAKGGRHKYSDAKAASDPAWRVVIAIGPSRLVAREVIALAGTAIASVLFSGLGPGGSAGAVMALVAAAVTALRREAFREGRGAVRRLVVDLGGRVEVSGASPDVKAGRLAPGSFVAPWLTVVRWRPEGARLARTVLVPPDAVDADAFRRLRVLLRWR
jgi:toxin CptA